MMKQQMIIPLIAFILLLSMAPVASPIGALAVISPVLAAVPKADTRAPTPTNDSNSLSPADEHPFYKKTLTTLAGARYEEDPENSQQLVGQTHPPGEMVEDSWSRLLECGYDLINDSDVASLNKEVEYNTRLLLLPSIMPVTSLVGSLAMISPVFAAVSKADTGTLTATNDPNSVSPADEYPLYKKALTIFAGGRYDEARGMFEKLVGQTNLSAEMMEDSWRKLAECVYALLNGSDVASIHKAIEHHTRFLAFYPDPRPGNDLVHYRLAKSYEKLNYHQAAAEQYRAVVSNYPASPYLPEGFAGIWDATEREGRFAQAIDEYRSYVNRHPEGQYAKIATFMIGDCHFRLGDPVNAELWFRSALRKWPDIRDLPRKILRDFGFHNYQLKHFSEAIGLFSLYLSLYPKDTDSPYVMYSLGHALAEKDQLGSAIKVLQATSDRYPSTREARDSAISIVDFEVERARRKTKAPIVFLGYDGYRDPLMAYESFLAEHPQGELAEYLLYRKGLALSKGNRPLDALYAFDRLLSLNAKGKYSDLGRRYLKTAAALVVGDYEKNENHLAIADVYFRSYGRHLLASDDARTSYRMARSLVELGLYTDALALLKELASREKDPLRRDNLQLFIAEMYQREGKDREAEDVLAGLMDKSDSQNQEVALRSRRNLAGLYFGRGEWEKAVRAYGDLGAAGRSAMNALDYQRFARALHISRQYGQALSYYRQAAKMVHDAPGRYPPHLLAEAYIGMGDSLYRENNFADGVEMYQRARTGLRERRDLWWVDLRLGQGYTRLNDPERLGKTFEEVKAAATAGDAFVEKMIDAWKAEARWNEQNRGSVE